MNKKRIIYSTNPNYRCENEEINTIHPNKQLLEVWIDKHRAGKVAVIIKGFVGNMEDIKNLAKMLKNKCGVGGTVKNGEIIIQGNIRGKVMSLLDNEGYKYKRVGG